MPTTVQRCTAYPSESDLLMHVHLTRMLFLLVVALWHQPGTAAVITNRGSTVDPNNDNYVGSGNLNVQPVRTVWLGVEGRAENLFEIDDSGGTTEYAVTVSVTNASGVDWKGYRFSLGLGGERGASAVLSPAGDGFGFDVSSVGDPLPESDGRLLLRRRTEDVLDVLWSLPSQQNLGAVHVLFRRARSACRASRLAVRATHAGTRARQLRAAGRRVGRVGSAAIRSGSQPQPGRLTFGRRACGA